MSLQNRQVLLVSRPAGIPQAEHFEIVTRSVPDLADGQVLIRNLFLGVEPAMRGWVGAVANYAEPVALGSVMRSFAVGEVIASRHADFVVGDRVKGSFGWQEYAVSAGANIERKITEHDVPVSAFLGVLGINGITAYFGLLDVCQPKTGDLVVVSTAAGGVGSTVGQIARIKGCTAIGIAGGPEKVDLCRTTFGFDGVVDYKAPDFEAALDALCPTGVDVYFDNTSGPISDAVMARLALRARIAICGTASISSWDPWPQGPRVTRHLLVKRARMQGFLMSDHAPRFEEAIAALIGWVREGRLAYREEILAGIEAAPDAIAGLYRGENLGRRLIRL